MRELTLVMAHFQNLGMLAEQQRVWQAYPAELRARLHVVVTDDCSPERPTADHVTVDGLASFRLFHLLGEKIRWNWPACRNLGAKVSTTEWLLLTDMDHVLPAETLRRVLDGHAAPMHAYRFARVDAPKPWPYALADCQAYKRHNDSWLMPKALFDYDNGVHFVCGHDERLSGLYGSSSEFKDRVLACAEGYGELVEPLIRYPREIIADASTHPSVYTRKGDPDNEAEMKRRKAARAQIVNWRPLRGLVKSVCVYRAVGAEVAA